MKSYFIIILLPILILVSGCSDHSMTVVSLDEFTLYLSKKVEVEVFDNMIIMNQGDTLTYEFNIGVDNLAEPAPKFIYMPTIQDSILQQESNEKIESTGAIVVHKRRFDPDRYRKQNISFVNIDNRSGKITYPISETGTIGIYVDSIRYGCISDYCDNIEFRLSGKNLSKESQELLIYAFQNNGIQFQ